MPPASDESSAAETSDSDGHVDATDINTPKPPTAAELRKLAHQNLIETTNLLLLFAVCLRCICSIYPYSGHKAPPMYGDFEAQRHWQEITVNLPVVDWYTNSTANNLLYWGLDYPPLTAYHSWLMGRVAQQLNASYVELHQSRGITTDAHKTFMRYTVLAADVLVYLPAMWLLSWSVHHRLGSGRHSNNRFVNGLRLLHLTVLLLFPGQILIDNGHFQYNNLSLGLSALAVAALLNGQLLAGCAAFALSLNYKQMVLYHALPVFVYLLRRSVPATATATMVPQSWCSWCVRFGGNVSAKGAVVLAVFAALWWPWLSSVSAALQVVHRIFPVARGVFEDKVANVWCVLNVAMPLKYVLDDMERG